MQESKSLPNLSSTKLFRAGGGESYSYASTIYIPRVASKRVFKVLAYKEEVFVFFSNLYMCSILLVLYSFGNRTLKRHSGMEIKTVINISDGTEVNAYCGSANSKISTNQVAFDDRKSALSERFPPHQIGSSKSGNGKLPRVLCAFGIFWILYF
jgi:hypothetical protein